MKIPQFLLSAVVVFLFTGFTTNHSSSKDTFSGTSNGFYFPASTLKSILSQGNGLRLYNASFPSAGGETLMAVATNGDSDAKNVPYFVFKGITNGRSDISSIDKSSAVVGCQNLGNGNRFAITIRDARVYQLLNQERATGIALDYTTDGRGNRTLKASPAMIQGRSIVIVNEVASIVIEDPCPLSCGSNPQQNYLCNMQ